MGKLKVTTMEEATELLSSTKEELNAAKEEKSVYLKENGLKKNDDHSSDKKHGKNITRMDGVIAKKRELIDELKTWMQENKPAKEKKERAVKYDYPEDVVSAEDKKKYRAKQRTAAKNADKPKKEAKEKKAKKEEAAPEEKPSKKEKSKEEKSTNKDGKKEKKEKKEKKAQAED